MLSPFRWSEKGEGLPFWGKEKIFRTGAAERSPRCLIKEWHRAGPMPFCQLSLNCIFLSSRKGTGPTKGKSGNCPLASSSELAEVISRQRNYFLRARAPAAATETTARETARPTKSSAPVSGFGLLVEGVSVVGSEGVTGSAGVSSAGFSS